MDIYINKNIVRICFSCKFCKVFYIWYRINFIFMYVDNFVNIIVINNFFSILIWIIILMYKVILKDLIRMWFNDFCYFINFIEVKF